MRVGAAVGNVSRATQARINASVNRSRWVDHRNPVESLFYRQRCLRRQQCRQQHEYHSHALYEQFSQETTAWVYSKNQFDCQANLGTFPPVTEEMRKILEAMKNETELTYSRGDGWWLGFHKLALGAPARQLLEQGYIVDNSDTAAHSYVLTDKGRASV